MTIMTKVLFVLRSMNVGGIEKAFLNLITSKMSTDEFDITLLLYQKSGGFLSYVPQDIHVEVINNMEEVATEVSMSTKEAIFSFLKKGKLFSAISYLVLHVYFRLTGDRSKFYAWSMRKHKVPTYNGYDIAIAYEGPDDLTTTFLLNRVGATRKVQWIHFDVSKYRFSRRFAGKYYSKFNKVFAVSNDALCSLLTQVPNIKNCAETYYNSISSEFCLKMAQQDIGFEDNFDGIRILTVGRLSPEKGQDIIPEIAADLCEHNIHFRWYIIGEGILREEIEAQIKHHDVSHCVFLLGVKKNPYPFFSQASLYVQTSIHEAFCLTIHEAQLFDLPVICTPCCGCSEKQLKANTYTIVARNAKKMSDAILTHLQKDEK